MPARPFDVTPATWAELDRLLDEVLDLPAAERAGWLDRLAAEQPATAARLRELLTGAPQAAGGPWSMPPLDTDAPLTPGRAEPGDRHAPGDRIGGYRLVSVLGEGGMGTVWLAERADGLVRRPVALKLPRAAGLRGQLVARLAREREILAGLTHPNIARLYDAGVDQDGQPFLALEHVEGQPIDVYARAAGLGVQERLRLLVQVARAVAHAHGRLVVHRDLKPSNVLVGADGQAKLLDFGIAKLLEPDAAAPETALTEAGGRVLTLPYASPEQITGELVGVGSDVYALGVMLFELLTGRRPFREEGRRALEHAILHVEPPRASAVATAPGVARALRGDLDAVLARALAKEPARRYPTADALADDLERHLSGRPVRAREGGAGYRAAKFVARHRLAVAACALAVAGVLGGAGAAVWQARVARAEQRRAEEVKAFVASLFEESDPYGDPARPLAVVDLLRRARERIDRELADRPELQVELLVLAGRGLYNLGEQVQGAELLEAAVATGVRSLGERHPLTRSARLTRAEGLRLAGKHDEMARELEALLPAAREDAARAPAELVRLLYVRAQLRIDEERAADAEADAGEALALARSRLGERHHETAASAMVLALARVYGEAGQAALDAAREAVRLALAAHGGDALHPFVIEARGILGRAEYESGDPAAAAATTRAVIAEASARLGPDNPFVGFKAENLVRYLLDAGEVEEAVASARRGVEVLARQHGGTQFLARAQATLGRALLAARRPAEALAALETAVPDLERIVGAAHGATRSARAARAVARAMAGRPEAARADVEASGGGKPSPRVLAARATALRLAGAPAEAAGLAREAIAAISPGPRAGLERAMVLPALGLALEAQGARAEARPLLEEAAALLGRFQARETSERAEVLAALARTR